MIVKLLFATVIIAKNEEIRQASEGHCKAALNNSTLFGSSALKGVSHSPGKGVLNAFCMRFKFQRS